MRRSVAHIAAALGPLVLLTAVATAARELPTAFECAGNEPFWTLTIRQDTAEFSSLASSLGPQISELRGSYGSLPHAAEPLFVWRGRAQGTPREVVRKINAEIGKVLSTPEAKKLMASAGVDVSLANSDEFAKLLGSELERWGKVVKETGAQVN